MVYEISCIHAGAEDCAFLVRSEDKEEVIRIAMHHGEMVHGLDDLRREHLVKVMYESD